MNVMMLLEMAQSGHGDRVALVSGAERLTYSELFAAAGRGARLLRESGARHAALLDESSPALAVLLFASAWAGMPFVPLNYRLTASELDALLARVEPAHLVRGVEGRRDFLLHTLGDTGPAASEWSMDPEEIAVLLFTSGTTGAPKAAVLRHQHLVSYILGSVEFGAAGEDEATLVSVPPYHIAGISSILSSVYAGRRIVQLPAFDADAWLHLARSEAVTHAFVVPTMLARIIDALGDVRDAELPHLRALAYGGGKMPQAVIERAMRLFPHTDFTNAYGLTETSSTISVLTPDDHRGSAASDDPVLRRRLISVGQPLPLVEVEIRDEDGKPVPAGARGEIHVRGEQVSGEYLGRGSQLLADGFFPTRDAGSLDEGGYLFLDGRIDDVIVRGGENMSPGEIEDVLIEHPAVSDCAVIGVPDEQWGEAVAAVVVARAGVEPNAQGDELRDQLRAWVRERLRSSRVPERIEFRDELPYNETGKLLRRVVREQLAAGT